MRRVGVFEDVNLRLLYRTEIGVPHILFTELRDEIRTDPSPAVTAVPGQVTGRKDLYVTGMTNLIHHRLAAIRFLLWSRKNKVTRKNRRVSSAPHELFAYRWHR